MVDAPSHEEFGRVAVKHEAKIDVKARGNSRINTVRRTFKFAKLMVKIAFAADTARRVLADADRREFLGRYGRKALSAIGQVNWRRKTVVVRSSNPMDS